MAAAYAYHIAENQPFLDGNKRTGLAAALLFLKFNEVALKDPGSHLYEAMIAIAERRMNKAALAELLRELAGSGLLDLLCGVGQDANTRPHRFVRNRARTSSLE